MVKIIINFVLVADPRINIIGASIGVIACYAVISFSNLIAIIKGMPKAPNLYQVFIKPALASALMGAGVYACYPLIYNYIGTRLFSDTRVSVASSMILTVGIGVLLYVVLVIAMQIITIEDFELIPNGKKYAKYLRIK